MKELFPAALLFFFLWLRVTAALFTIRGLRETVRSDALFLFAFSISVPFIPALLRGSQAAPYEPHAMEIAGRALAEIVAGVLLAAPLALACESFSLGGRFADIFRGAHQAELQLPFLEARVSFLEFAGAMLFFLFFFTLGGYQLLIRLLAVAPPGAPLTGALGLGALASAGYQQALIGFSQDTLAAGLFLASGVLIFSALLDVSAAVLSRAVSAPLLPGELGTVKLVASVLLFACALGGSERWAQSVFIKLAAVVQCLPGVERLPGSLQLPGQL